MPPDFLEVDAVLGNAVQFAIIGPRVDAVKAQLLQSSPIAD